MKILHEKSNCCGAKIIRFGGKRRQCCLCRKTWRVHPARHGRKRLRKESEYLQKVFCRGFAVKQLSRSNLSVDALYKRFHHVLKGMVKQDRKICIRGKRLILITDALWHYFDGYLWTLYIIAIKAPGSKSVIVFDPTLLPGKENASGWNKVLNRLPRSTMRRIYVLVSDGLRGIDGIADRHNWIMQRCHFHLLSQLQKMRGKRATTPGRAIREEIYITVNRLLTEKSLLKINTLSLRLKILAEHQLCPKNMRMQTREFLRKLKDFRSYLEFPDLEIPTTVNVMESINSLIRRKAPTVNTPQAWLLWATAVIRFKSIFTCK